MNKEDMENADGVRLSWSAFPARPSDATNLPIPLGALYTPTKLLDDLGQVEYKPVICANTKCGAVLNPYCSVNYSKKSWSCVICNHRNQFPPHYQAITELHRPAELLEQYTTLEYIVSRKPHSPAFIFVVDLAIIAEELDALKNSIRQALLLLPDDALVGLITFGANVHLYELSFEAIPKTYTFMGNQMAPMTSLQIKLGLEPQVNNPNQPSSLQLPSSQQHPHNPQNPQQPQHAQQHPPPGGGGGGSMMAGGLSIRGKERFLTPISECESHFNSILDDLTPDPWMYPSDIRPTRAYGPAIGLALNLLEMTHHNMNARVLSFIGGVPVNVPGEIADKSFSIPIRSHKDISRDEAILYEKATQFYDQLGLQAAKNRHIIDIFACCLDQVGIAEMSTLTTQTGGELILDDSFTRGAFQGSIKRLLSPEMIYDEQGNTTPSNVMQMAFSAELRVITTENLYIDGALGHCRNLETPGLTTNMKNPVGAGKTQLWYLGGLMTDSTFAIYFSVNTSKLPAIPAGNAAGAAGAVNEHQQHHHLNGGAGAGGTILNASTSPYPRGVIQFITTYKNSIGIQFVRVTTISRQFVDNIINLRVAFDQEAAAVLMTRRAIEECILHQDRDVRRWLDRKLIQLCSEYGFYTQDDPNSFKLTNDFGLFPQFMFYLRRSQMIQIFNCSPDETAFFRTICLKQNTNNTLTMIQPRLIAYTTNNPPEPVLLDTSQLHPTRILLLDTFFHVVIWYGSTISQWKTNNLHLDPQYAYLGQLLKAPLIEAKQRIASRLPTPRFIECVEGHSQARFVLSKLNPSTGATLSGSDGEQIQFTEDVNLMTFTYHLKRLVVKQPKK